jgi:hypothetical protein
VITAIEMYDLWHSIYHQMTISVSKNERLLNSLVIKDRGVMRINNDIKM